jgi:hypothetical protein
MSNSSGPAVRWRSVLRYAVASGLIIAIAFNAAILGLHLWGQGGQKTVVEIESLDGAYRVLVDGNPMLEESAGQPKRVPFDAPESGGVSVYMPFPLSTFPEPSGLDSIEVISPSGEILLRDEFNFLDPEVWRVDGGPYALEDGLFVPQSVAGNSLWLLEGSWRDYTLRVTYRNNRGAVIGSHVTADGGAFFHMELIYDYPNGFAVYKDGQLTGTGYGPGGYVHTDTNQSLRSLAAMLTEPYPYFLLAGLIFLAATIVVAPPEARLRAWLGPGLRHRPGPQAEVALAAAIVAAAFGLALYVGTQHYGSFPHYPDEVLYIFQAKLFAAGKLSAQIPGGLTDAFFLDVQKPAFVDRMGGKWASFYPFGHPLALSVGEIFGAIWVVPAVVGAGTVLLTQRIGSRLFDARTSLVAAILLAASPFFLLQSSNFLSHNTTTLYILLALFFILKRDRPLLYGALAGLFFGLGINTRALNMVALALPFGVLMLAYYRISPDRASWLRHTGAFVAVNLVMVGAMLAFGYEVTGEAFKTTQSAGVGDVPFAFGSGHTLDFGVRNELAQLTTLLLVFNAWPAFIGMVLVLVPFLLGTRSAWDYFLLACAVSVTGIYVLLGFTGVYEGPRYWYEAMPFLVLLSARGLERAAVLLGSAASHFWQRFGVVLSEPLQAGRALLYAAVVALVIWGGGGWLLNWRQTEDSFVPQGAAAVDGVFGVDNRLSKLADDADLDHALVLVQCPGGTWCYAPVMVRNSADFDGDVVWALYLEGRNHEIIAAFPGRTVYVANFDQASIQPYEPELDP